MGPREVEPSVQMRLYTLNKRQFVMVFVTFFVFFGVVVLVGLAGPPITQSTQQNATILSPVPANFKTGPFVLRSPELDRYHQQLWLLAVLVTDHHGKGKFDQPFHVGVRIVASEKGKKPTVLLDGKMHNRSRNLHCDQGGCDELILLHLGYLDYRRYTINITFFGLEELQHNVVDVEFHFRTYNPSFVKLEIWFRFVFQLLTFITACLFAHSLRKFSMRDWSTEQKWMTILLPLLLLYNNPIFALTFLVKSWVPGMLDAMFQATFLCTLLLFWLCWYHGIRQVKKRFCGFYLPKVVVVGLLWLVAVITSTWQEINEISDPTYNYKLDTGYFMVFKIFFFIVGALYLLYLIFLLVRAYAELRAMPYFDLRLKFMTALMFIVLSISITIMVMRFGVGVLEDNFVAELATHYQNSAEFLAFYGLLNFYLYTMAFVYSPSKNAVFESHFKDNPALSMLNDSDDDVIYGSDHEESTALNKKVTGRYDSDDDNFN